MIEKLQVGNQAPDFTLLDHRGNRITLQDYQNMQPVLLIFYPGDDTPGCTKQLCAIRDDAAEFEKYQVAVFGINPGGVESHQKFIRKYGLTASLLIDNKLTVAEQYGATRRILGKQIVNRSVVLIDKQGVIRYLERGLPPDSEILEAVKQL